MKLNIQTNVNLQTVATMALPAIASHFVEVNSLEEIEHALAFSQENNLDIVVLGEGSNTLFTANLSALVIQVKLKGLKILNYDKIESGQSADKILYAAAGENWDETVQFSIENECYGIENLSWIPGAVGAAPIQNIGAYGVEVSHVLEWVEVIKINQNHSPLKIERMSLEACQLSYRESIFKQALKDQVIITGVAMRLSSEKKFHLQYGALDSILDKPENELTLQEVRDTIISIRQSKLPDPALLPNSGSFFKNPIITLNQYVQLQKEHPTIPSYPVNETYCKVPAGWLIDQAGWKGRREGKVGVHDRQALVLINYQSADGSELLSLAKKIQTDIENKYDISLEIEPRIYN